MRGNEKMGFIFMCNGRSKPECYIHRVFGLPAARFDMVEKIKPGDTLFLFDFDVKLLYGIYEATTPGKLDWLSGAFNRRFPAQVMFRIYRDCLPLHESSFRHAIQDNYHGVKFKQELNSRQVEALMSLFQPINLPSPAAVPQYAIQPTMHCRKMVQMETPSGYHETQYVNQSVGAAQPDNNAAFYARNGHAVSSTLTSTAVQAQTPYQGNHRYEYQVSQYVNQRAGSAQLFDNDAEFYAQNGYVVSSALDSTAVQAQPPYQGNHQYLNYRSEHQVSQYTNQSAGAAPLSNNNTELHAQHEYVASSAQAQPPYLGNHQYLSYRREHQVSQYVNESARAAQLSDNNAQLHAQHEYVLSSAQAQPPYMGNHQYLQYLSYRSEHQVYQYVNQSAGAAQLLDNNAELHAQHEHVVYSALNSKAVQAQPIYQGYHQVSQYVNQSEGAAHSDYNAESYAQNYYVVPTAIDSTAVQAQSPSQVHPHAVSGHQESAAPGHQSSYCHSYYPGPTYEGGSAGLQVDTNARPMH